MKWWDVSLIKEKCPYVLHVPKQGFVLAPQLLSIFFDMMLLMAASSSSTCTVTGQGRVSFLSFFVIFFMPTTVYFWHIPSLCRSRSSISFPMRHTGLASRLASRRLRSCFSKISPKSILNLSQVNPKIQFTRAQLYHKYPALKQHNILNTDTLQRENTKIVGKSMCLYAVYKPYPPINHPKWRRKHRPPKHNHLIAVK